MSDTIRAQTTELTNLNDSGLLLADAREDIRGRTVVDRDGAKIGHVTDLFIDQTMRKIRMLEIHAGGFLGIGERHVLLPAGAITSITPDTVRVNEIRERLLRSPAYDPRLMVPKSHDAWESLYGYYDLTPYWALNDEA
jgi:sporulation protein YlmC with PRC-barrel domain